MVLIYSLHPQTWDFLASVCSFFPCLCMQFLCALCPCRECLIWKITIDMSWPPSPWLIYDLDYLLAHKVFYMVPSISIRLGPFCMMVNFLQNIHNRHPIVRCLGLILLGQPFDPDYSYPIKYSICAINFNTVESCDNMVSIFSTDTPWFANMRCLYGYKVWSFAIGRHCDSFKHFFFKTKCLYFKRNCHFKSSFPGVHLRTSYHWFRKWVNSLAPGGFDYSLKCSQANATTPHWSLVNIGSGNGLVPSGNKPLPEPMLT